MTDTPEPQLDRSIEIIDTHHHLFDRANRWWTELTGSQRFLVDDYVDTYLGGDTTEYRVVATVAVEGHSMYRSHGPANLRTVGETEFLNGQAAMAASGVYGPTLVAAGIVGTVDLTLGADVQAVLEAHIAAAPARFKGIRQEGVWDADPEVLGGPNGPFRRGPHFYADGNFRKGFAHLAPLGLSFDAFVIAPQLADVADLARSFPDTSIVLNHLGNPVGTGRHRGRQAEEFPQWRAAMLDLARCDNVTVKMGGMGTFLAGSPYFRADPPAAPNALAQEWRPYVESCVEIFGADRMMFETNAPTDRVGPFANIVNAYQQILSGCSDDERHQIFAGTAEATYHLTLPVPGADPGSTAV